MITGEVKPTPNLGKRTLPTGGAWRRIVETIRSTPDTHRSTLIFQDAFFDQHAQLAAA